METNNFINNLHPLATYAEEVANSVASTDAYGYTSTYNNFSLTNKDVSSIVTNFADSILKDSAPLNQEIEEFINDVFWDLV